MRMCVHVVYAKCQMRWGGGGRRGTGEHKSALSKRGFVVLIVDSDFPRTFVFCLDVVQGWCESGTRRLVLGGWVGESK